MTTTPDAAQAHQGQAKSTRQPPKRVPVAKLRTRLNLTQAEVARLLAVSVRSLATVEAGTAPTGPVARRLTELERLIGGLSEVIGQTFLGQWLRTPNQAFGGSKPLEVIERGESDRLWEMVFSLRSGVPS